MTKAIALREEQSISTEAYLALVEELQALKTEQGYDMSVRGLQWCHEWGKIIRDYYPKVDHKVGKNTGEDSLTSALKRISVDVGRTTRMLWLYVKLFDLYPDLQETLNQYGKDVSLRKLLELNPEEGEETDKRTKLLKRLGNDLTEFAYEDLEDGEQAAILVIVGAIRRLLEQ